MNGIVTIQSRITKSMSDEMEIVIDEVQVATEKKEDEREDSERRHIPPSTEFKQSTDAQQGDLLRAILEISMQQHLDLPQTQDTLNFCRMQNERLLSGLVNQAVEQKTLLKTFEENKTFFGNLRAAVDAFVKRNPEMATGSEKLQEYLVAWDDAYGKWVNKAS